MKATWQLQQAKNRFSEVVELALTEGPQVVTRYGREAVVILAVGTYRRLATRKRSLVGFMRDSPLAGVDLPMDRSKDVGREVDL